MDQSQALSPFRGAQQQHSMYMPASGSATRRVSNESEGYSSLGNIVVANEHEYETSRSCSGSPRSCRPSPSQVELHGQVTPHGNVRKLVEHNYHDYSQVPAPSADGTPEDQQQQQATTVFVTRGGTPTLFPLKLYTMLDDAMSADPARDRQLPGVPSGQILSQIVCFQPHGRAFKVQDLDLFKEYVLPVYFGKMKYSSFLRQLNLYGFTRISRGADKGGYYHELFLQHRPYLIYRIQRMKVKGSGTRAAANPDKEPNFYAMTYMRDIPFPTGGDGAEAEAKLPELNPKLVAAANKQESNNASANTNEKRKATTSIKAGQATSEADAILDDDMLFEPLPIDITPAARSTHRQVSMTSGDLIDSHSSLDSFSLDAVEGEDDVMAGVTDDLDLDLSMLEDLLADNDREGSDSTQAVATSPTVSSAPRVEPRPMAVPPPLMSHAAAARYNASFVRAEPVAAHAAAPKAISNFDNSEITFLQSLFAAEAAVPISPIKIAAAAKLASGAGSTNKSHMDATANAQADYRNNAATNGGRSRFQNTRAARTA